jgi:hypothetical protein
MKLLKRLVGILVLLAIIALPFVSWWKAQAIEDWWKLRNYSPPPAIAKLAEEDTMTPPAVHDFYVNHPKLISGVSAFRQNCPESEQAIVLGCYRPDQQGIFIYTVNDERLNGVQEVTAAHEMLHAAYDRLSDKDRNHIDGLLKDYYQNNLTDSRIKDEINSYKKTEPGQEVNEMHSIFGTEAANLPAPLEDYYKRYFTDRSAVVKFASHYQKEFTSRVAQIDDYDARLDLLKQQIRQEEESLKNQLAKIQTDRARLDSEKSNGNIDEYNSQVPAFNEEVDTYNQGIAKLQNDINTYNTLVIKRNALAGELRSLQNSIDTRLTTQPAQ